MITLLLLLAGDVETNPGPDSTLSSSFPCGLCEVDANWSNGGIACENCDRWYHRSCADLSLSSFGRLANTSLVWICKQCNSSNFADQPFHYSQLYLTVSNSFDLLSTTKTSTQPFSPNITSPFAPKVHSSLNSINCIENQTSHHTLILVPQVLSLMPLPLIHLNYPLGKVTLKLKKG